MKLSIIVPVYNAATTIERTLTSLTNQTNYTFDYEVVLVNDGSTDNSATVLNNWVKNHPNFIVFHNKNQGVYLTRNFALTKVTGDWVWMIDSDDFVLPQAFEKLDRVLSDKNIDLLAFGHTEGTADNDSLERIPSYNGATSGLSYLAKNDGRLYLWTHIYSQKYLKGHNITFAGKSFSLEDFLFNINILSKNPNVFVLNQALYHYEYNAHSISKKNTLANRLKQLESSKNLHTSILEIRNSYKNSSSEYQIIEKKLAHSIVGLFFSLIKEQYPAKYTSEVLQHYKQIGLLPLNIDYGEVKKNIFVKMINMGYPIVLLNKIINTINSKSNPE